MRSADVRDREGIHKFYAPDLPTLHKFISNSIVKTRAMSESSESIWNSITNLNFIFIVETLSVDTEKQSSVLRQTFVSPPTLTLNRVTLLDIHDDREQLIRKLTFKDEAESKRTILYHFTSSHLREMSHHSEIVSREDCELENCFRLGTVLSRI